MTGVSGSGKSSLVNAVLLKTLQKKLNRAITYPGKCDGIDGILTKISDKTIVEGLMMLTPFASDSKEPDVVAFVGKYKEKYNADPNQFAADGYDAIYVIKAAIEKAGFSKDNTKDFQKGLVAAMTQIEVDGVTGTMKWTADGENNKGAMALVFRDGVAVAFEKK